MPPTHSIARMPALCIPHGGGPLPLLGDPAHESLTKWLTTAATNLPKPQSILTVSAHWEERQPTVSSSAHPPLIYDYYGFPEESYSIKYDAPGSPQLAQRIADLLNSAGLPCVLDSKRGWDHGVFVPLKLLYPAADISIVEMSMLKSLSAEEHLKLGEALAPLRDEGIMIVGSGLSYHNMREFVFRGRGDGKSANTASQEFDAYIQDALLNPVYTPQQRRQLLVDWEQAQVSFDEKLMGAKVSGYVWS